MNDRLKWVLDCIYYAIVSAKLNSHTIYIMIIIFKK